MSDKPLRLYLDHDLIPGTTTCKHCGASDMDLFLPCFAEIPDRPIKDDFPFLGEVPDGK